MNEPNVQISLSLFRNILCFFELCYFSKHTFPNVYKFDEIRSALYEKQHSINLRTAYTKIVKARNDLERNSAQSNYKKLKYNH